MLSIVIILSKHTVAVSNPTLYCSSPNRVLGKGSFATVKLAVRKTDGTKWAVKVIEKTALSQEDEEALKNEVMILEVRWGNT